MRIKNIFTVLTLCGIIGGCDAQGAEISPTQLDVSHSDSADMSNKDIAEEEYSFSNECFIELGSDISINGTGAWIDDNCITISQSGVYTVEGQISDGMIHVDTDETVKIVLSGAEITNKNGAAVIAEGGKLIIEAAEGTENALTDGKDYDFSRAFEKEELHRSAVHSDGELYLIGSGSVDINARYKDAVYAKDALYINGCTVDITADKSGLGSEKLINAENCDISIEGGGDCIKTESETDGGIVLNNCTLNLTTEKDGIQAGTALKINGGSISVTTTGDTNADAELSSKGLKAADMVINDSSITVNSTDHSVKCNGKTEITGGKLILSSEYGKGIASEGELIVNADIDIIKSTEGMESKTTFTINGGNINITASDDGLNTGGDDFLTDHSMNINGGTVVIDAGGDGLDANGDINVTGGTVVIFGPDNNANSSLDSGDMGYKTTVTGGKVLAMGSMGMMSQPSGECISSQAFSAAKGSVISVKDESGNEIISVTAPKAVNGAIYCGENAESCKIYVDGTETAMQAGFNGGMGGFGGGKRDFGGERDKNIPDMGEMPDMGELPEGGAFSFDGGTPPEKPEGMPDFGGFGGDMGEMI